MPAGILGKREGVLISEIKLGTELKLTRQSGARRASERAGSLKRRPNPGKLRVIENVETFEAKLQIGRSLGIEINVLHRGDVGLVLSRQADERSRRIPVGAESGIGESIRIENVRQSARVN